MNDEINPQAENYSVEPIELKPETPVDAGSAPQESLDTNEDSADVSEEPNTP